MARQEVNIGVEGNDGTGDSIRESFRKVNENFSELYAVFGQGGTIRFTSLSDTPNELTPNTIALVNDAGTLVQLAELASNSALDETKNDTITFSFDAPGKLVISTAFTELADDTSPSLGASLYANNKGIAGVSITQQAADDFLTDHGVTVSIDDLVITKGYGDRRYITSGLPIRIADEPAGVSQYTLNINRYQNNNVEVLNHGFDSGINGTAYIFRAEDTDPANATSNTTYYIRYVDDNNFTLHSTEVGAASEDPAVALATKILISGTIAPGDSHTLTDASYDSNLAGNFLSDVALPRKSITRRQGDTMTGALYLHDHPGELAGEGAPNGVEDLQAATKYYVDNTSYSSPTNLYVSSQGDDTMAGVPNGKEGTSFTYAYKTINAAAARAAEIMYTSPNEPGPYFQTVTKDGGTTAAEVVTADVDTPIYETTRLILEQNRDFIIKEVTGFLAYTYPDFTYDIGYCERDTGLIIDAIAIDINRGLNANFLTRQAAERYYSSASSRKAITTQLAETTAGFEFARDLSIAALNNSLFREKVINDITRSTLPVVTTATNHGLSDRNIVVFKDIGGMTQIEGEKLYVKVITDQTFELFTDVDLEIPYNTSSYDGYTTGGRLGLIYQVDEDQYFNLVAGDPAARTAVESKWDLLINIITNGVDAGADVVYGSTYKVVLNNGNQTFVDQGDPNNTDILPGKVLVGERSGAVGRIVSYNDNDGTEGGNDTIQMHLLEAKDFAPGEPVKYGNYVKKKQITIFVESGFYEEDYPIKLANNVSLKGDEFRRVIIRPKNRVSQSPWATTYFFRDKEFDGLQLASEGEPFLNQSDELQGFFGYHYLKRADRPINIGPAITNPGGFNTAANIISLNKDFITEEVIEYIANNIPDLSYDPVKCRRDIDYILTAVAMDTALGTNYNAVTQGLAYQRASASAVYGDQKDATISAIRYAKLLTLNLSAVKTNGIATARAINAFDEVINILDKGVVSTDTEADDLEFPAPTGGDANKVNAKDQLQVNREFIKDEIIAYINTNYPALVYNQTKCARDVGYIVDALSYDVLYGGNSASIVAAESYFVGTTSQLGPGQQAATIDAYQRLAAVVDDVVQASTIIPSAGNTTVQDVSSYPAATATEGTEVDGLVQIIEDVITAGDLSGLPAEVLPSVTWTLSAYQSARSAILTSISSTQDEVIDFINDNFVAANFDYNEAKCRRDIGLIVDAVALDLVKGGVEFATEAQGQYYYNYISKYITDPVYGFLGQEAITRDAIQYIATASAILLTGSYPSGQILQTIGAADYVAPDLRYGAGENDSASIAGQLVDRITFAFDTDYNPPKRNDEMDVFLMGDATICRNVTVQGHGGFMCVLDPDGQVLTKSPYIQTCSSFSKSINQKTFAGGMYVDAFVGNIPASIPETIDPGPVLGGSQSGKIDNFTLWIRSPQGQGLFIRPPQLPCPFYVEGRRYQVNAISDYDSGNGWCKIYLDRGSNNGVGYDETQFANGLYYRDVFLQTAGNRSMLANDFTQINDLGYGLICNNGAFSEQVSTFTYYCQAAFYANNGSEIRSLNGSNGYGNFGLVAEGADPNEIPDQVTLLHNMVQPAKAFTSPTFTNAFDEPSIYVTDLNYSPSPSSIITVNHPVAGRLNYVIQTVTNMSNTDNDGDIGESATDVVVTGVESVTNIGGVGTPGAFSFTGLSHTGGSGTGATFDVNITAPGVVTVNVASPGSGYAEGETLTIPSANMPGVGSDLTFDVDDIYGGTYGGSQTALPAGVHNNNVYKLDLRADDVRADDFFGTIQETITNGSYIEYRDSFQHIFKEVNQPDKLVTRPSTAINFDESDDITYRSTAFSNKDGTSQDLAVDEILSTFEVGYDHIEIEADRSHLLDVDPDDPGKTLGATQYDTKIAIVSFTDAAKVTRITRDIAGRQPGDGGYTGGMIFAWYGRLHQVTNYTDQGGYAIIEISDVSAEDVSGLVTAGLVQAISTSETTIFYAGLTEDATAEITIAISLTRATGHDFTQIGTGSYNDSNYPNVILGDPENSLAEFYTDSPTATTGQVWERRKGRVFFVSTDQYGFFRVGKFFSVDQATGDITFAGEIGLSNANSLGFKRGVTINEFSADDSMVDESGTAVPTEKAIVGYINRRLGYGASGQILPAPSGNRIGPGAMMLNGGSAMEADMDMGANVITNVANPGTDGSAATNKNYVDDKIKSYDELSDLRNVEFNSVAGNDLLVATGYLRMYVSPPSGGVWNVGDTISIGGNTATIIDIEATVDEIIGSAGNSYNVSIVTYNQTAGTFSNGDVLTNGTATAGVLEDPVVEWANASEAAASDINVSVSRSASAATYNLQIEAGAIINADVNASAAIAQSKLAMQTAGTRANATGITQGDLGLATFKDTEFTHTNGFVELKTATSSATGITPEKHAWIATDHVLGRKDAGTGAVTAVPFTDVLADGGAVVDADFPTFSGTSDQALIRTGATSYSVTNISDGATGSTIAKRKSTGAFQANSYIIGGTASYEILAESSGTLTFKTPAQGVILTAVGGTGGGSPTYPIVNIPGKVDVGGTGIAAESSFQSGSSYAGESYVATDWVYTKFIEASNERDASGTGIALGDGGGFASSAADTIIHITGGSERLVINDSTVTVKNALSVDGATTLKGNITLGDASTDLISVNGRFNTNLLPSTDNSINIGQGGGTPLRINTVHAVLFSGTATTARYADLAENYLGDADYEPGTVLVFGGSAEVTVCTAKGDRKAAGVVTTNPAHLMNSALEGDHVVGLALQGRVPCKVIGKVAKGDMLVTSSIPGYAMVDNDPKLGTVLGKAVQEKTDDARGIVEIVVGRV